MPERQPGIIPAGAGHLLARKRRARRWWDHPRRCGAFDCRGTLVFVSEGSSPQVRGIFYIVLIAGGDPGIIPAGAGHLQHPA